MSRIFISIVLVFVLGLFHSCKNTSEPGDVELTAEQLQALYVANQYLITGFALYMVNQSVAAANGDLSDMPLGFFSSGYYYKTNPDLPVIKPSGEGEFTHSGSGCWDLTHNESNEGLGYQIDTQVCFASFDSEGHPTSDNDNVNIALDISTTQSSSYEDYISESQIDEVESLVVQGIKEYLAGNSDLMANGSEKVTYFTHFSYSGDTQKGTYVYDFLLKDILLAPNSTVPKSGSIDFNISYDDQSGNDEIGTYKIPGSVTFNGTNIVKVDFAGKKFDLDISEFVF
jgi:hypothetical protein